MKFEKGWVEPLFFLPGSDLFERAFFRAQMRFGSPFFAKCQYGLPILANFSVEMKGAIFEAWTGSGHLKSASCWAFTLSSPINLFIVLYYYGDTCIFIL